MQANSHTARQAGKLTHFIAGYFLQCTQTAITYISPFRMEILVWIPGLGDHIHFRTSSLFLATGAVI